MKEIKEIIRSQLLSTNKRAMGIIGPAGVGKSDIIKELASELNRPIIELRAGYKTPGDLIGVPYAETDVIINGVIYKLDDSLKQLMKDLNLSAINTVYYSKILDSNEKAYFHENKEYVLELIALHNINIKLAIQLAGVDKIEFSSALEKVKSIAVKEEVENITAFLKPEWLLELQHTPNGIFLLEEISNASQEVQGALYEVLLDWAINNVQIPRTINILFTGNRSEDAIGIASDLQSTFYTRGTLLNIQNSDVNVEDWKEWAIKHSIHPAIISYLDVNNMALLHTPIENSSYCTPRTWAILSNNLYDNEHLYKINSELWQKIVNRLILTNIPEEQGFSYYYLEGMKLEKPEEYIKNPSKYFRAHDMFMQITYNLAYHITTLKSVSKDYVNFFNELSNRDGLLEFPVLLTILNTIDKVWYKNLQELDIDIGLDVGRIVTSKLDEIKNMKKANF